MQLQKRTLLGIGITTSPKEAILSYIKEFFSSKTQDLRPKTYVTIVTPNAEQIVLADKNVEFRKILNDADIAIPDGAPVARFLNRRSKVLGLSSKTTNLQPKTYDLRSKVVRISGIDFMDDLCRLAAEEGWPVAFIGGRDGVAEEALSRLQTKYPGLKGFADDGPLIQITNNKLQITRLPMSEPIGDGPLRPRSEASGQANKFKIKNNKSQTGDNSDYIDALSRRIEEERVRVVFVGLGAPKQEYFIDALRLKILDLWSSKKTCAMTKTQDLRSTNPLIFMSVGGSFDIFAGKIRRAPKCVQKLGFEWLWRLFLEPWRIGRQMALFKFFALVLLK